MTKEELAEEAAEEMAWRKATSAERAAEWRERASRPDWTGAARKWAESEAEAAAADGAD